MTPANAASFFVDEPIEEGAGDRVALVTPTTRLTYRELRELTDGTAGALRRLGVERGERVALLLPDGPAFAAAFFAAVKLGAVAVPLNTRLAGGDLRAILDDCRPRVVVTVGDLAAAARGSDGGGRVVTWDELSTASPAPTPRFPAEPVGEDAMAFWLYTSGTTGTPKAAMHAHRTLLAWHGYGRGVLAAGPGDRVLATSKLFFAYALGSALLIPLACRASTYLCPDWPDPQAMAHALDAYRPTLFFSVPTFYARMLRAELAPGVFASVRLAVSAGERLLPPLYHAWRGRFGVEILDGIGATETVFMVLSNRPGQSRPGSTGQPVPGVEARVVDGDGKALEAGGEGVLWVKAPSAATGYWGHPEQTARAFDGGWFRTGDVYARDADGYYEHRGREDDFFKVAGQWVSPGRVESALLEHPAVAEAGVAGAEDRGGLVKPFAFVVPGAADAEPPGLVAELLGLLERRLKPHERPRDVLIVRELPRTATGKLQRYKLRALVSAAPALDARGSS